MSNGFFAENTQHRAVRGWEIAFGIVCALLLAVGGALGFACVELSKANAEKQTLTVAAAERDQLRTELTDAQEKLEEAKQTVQTQNTRIVDLQAQMEQSGSEAKQKLEELNGKLTDLNTQNSKLKQQKEELEKGKKTAEEQLKTKQEELDAAKAEQEALQEKIDELNAELDDCYAEISELESTVSRYETRSAFFDRYVGIVCPGDNRHYHRYGCSKLSLTGSWRVIRIDTTYSYTPCPECE